MNTIVPLLEINKTDMCYWVGTKKVKNELLKQKGEKLDEHIRQLVYSDFLVSDGIGSFRDEWLLMAHARPVLSAFYQLHGTVLWGNFTWGIDVQYQNGTGRTLPLIRTEQVFRNHAELLRTCRCVVPLDGYYEFYRQNKLAYPYFMYPKDAGVVWYAAGVYKSDGEGDGTCSLLTVPANDFVAKIHNQPQLSDAPRMLVILTLQDAIAYLNPALTGKEVRAFFKPAPNDWMQAHTVIRFLQKKNSHVATSEQVRQFVHYPELAG